MDISIGDSSHICYGTNNGKIFTSEDGGETWQLRFYDVFKTEFINYVEMFNGRQGVAMGDHSRGDVPQILKTDDGGRSWVSVNDSAIGGISSCLWYTIDFVSSETGYFYPTSVTPGTPAYELQHYLYKTVDGGKTWCQVHDRYVHQTMKFHNEDIGLIYEEYYRQGICRTLDGGRTWQFFPAGTGSDLPPPHTFAFLPDNPAIVWALCSNAAYCSQDTGRTWQKQLDLTGGNDMVMTSGGRGWILTEYNLYYTENAGGLTKVESAVEETPQMFLSSRNYPNPFNNETVLSFSLQQASAVELSVISLRGEVVKTLLSRRCSAGSHRVIWNGCDDRGLPVASGTYLARLRCGEQAVSQKMVLLR
ncbi:T9SS type A sorting domain-containing protein [candidate division KSB1 bacterium]|nr:T9SS type A sorting domain-containing protein [candidate division KSB1 bacterium]